MVVRGDVCRARRTWGFVLGGALLTLATLGHPRTAHASPDFPVALRDALSKRFPGSTFCVPLCNACHLTLKGGPFEYNAFGIALLGSGLIKDDPSLVEGALNKELASKRDVDGDGATDEEELAAGTAPAFAGGAKLCPDDNPLTAAARASRQPRTSIGLGYSQPA